MGACLGWLVELVFLFIVLLFSSALLLVAVHFVIQQRDRGLSEWGRFRGERQGPWNGMAAHLRDSVHLGAVPFPLAGGRGWLGSGLTGRLLALPIALTKALLGCVPPNPAKIRELAGMVKRRWDETKRQAGQCHAFMQVLDRLPHLVQWEAGRPKGLNVVTELDIAGEHSQAARAGVFRELRSGLETCGRYMRLTPHPNLLVASALFARCWQICQAQEDCAHEQECPLVKFANSVDFQV